MLNILVFLYALFLLFWLFNIINEQNKKEKKTKHKKNEKINSSSVDGYFNDKVRSARVVQKVTKKLKDELEEELFK